MNSLEFPIPPVSLSRLPNCIPGIRLPLPAPAPLSRHPGTPWTPIPAFPSSQTPLSSTPGTPEPPFVGTGTPWIPHHASPSPFLEPWTIPAEPGYWDTVTQICQVNQHVGAEGLEMLRHRYNQSRGLHTSQWLYGCDLLADGNFISFELASESFVAADDAAEITRRIWEEKGNVAEGLENYLKHKELEHKDLTPIPFPWNSMHEFHHYPIPVVPDVHVSRKEEHGTLILSCHVYGFYPNTTAVSWMKGSEIRDQKMEWGGIVPNSDGTFHTWARIEALPEEWEQYRCQVEHPGMLEPGIFTWGEAGNVGIEDFGILEWGCRLPSSLSRVSQSRHMVGISTW
uniref:Ig-like domain-containing protein n=1 Tax=Cyanistes caeruleus TaxID=156563 RepID=A0A8C0Z856_CYACU